MVEVIYDDSFKKVVKKLSKSPDFLRLKKQIRKIVLNPLVGKPMRYGRKGTRELYVKPFRISYIFFSSENRLVFLDLYHKDAQ